MRIVATFVLDDDGLTLLYQRFYQKFIRLPVLNKIIAQLAMPMYVYIAHEDRRVLIAQQPKVSGLKTGEILVQGDLPIIEFRKKRGPCKAWGNSRDWVIIYIFVVCFFITQ